VADTEIRNVGGPDGVASEATLMRLVELTRSMQRGTNAAAQAEARLRKAHNDSVAKGTKELGLLGKAADLAGKGLNKYANVLQHGVSGVSDFSKYILGSNSALQRLVEYADQSTHQFRELSQVGAGFSNSIFEMNKVAATSGMAMTQFYETISGNSEVLRMLGGTVTDGAKRFSEISKGIRQSDLGQRLLQLGFTAQDINEGFLSYSNNMQRQGLLQRMSNAELIEGSANYLKEIDLLAKATGKNREELLNQTSELQNSAAFQALQARASADGAGQLERNMASLASFLPGFTGDIMDMASGLRGSQLEIGLSQSAAGRQMVDLIRNMEGMSNTEFLRNMQQLGPLIGNTVAAMDPAQMRALRAQGSPLAALFDAMPAFRAMANIDPDAAKKEQEQRDKLTSLFAGFSDAISRLSSFITESFLNSETFASLKRIGDSLSETFKQLFGEQGEGGAFANASEGIKSFTTTVDTWFVENITTPLQEFIDDFNKFSADGGTPLEFLKEKVTEAGNAIADYLLGPIESEPGGPNRGQRTGGILKKITDGIANAFSGDGASNLLTSISDSIKGVYEKLTADGTFISDITKSVTEIFTNLTADEGFITKISNAVTKIFTDLTSDQGFITKINDAISSIFSDQGVISSVSTAFSDFMKNNAVIKAMSDAISNAMDTVETSLRSFLGMSPGETFTEKLTSLVTDLTNSILDIINQKIPTLISTTIASVKNKVSEVVDDTTGGLGGTDLSETNLQASIQKFLTDPSSLDYGQRQDLIQTLREQMRQQGKDFSGGYMPGWLQGMVDLTNDTINWDALITKDSVIKNMIRESGNFPTSQSQPSMIPPTNRIGTLRSTGNPFVEKDGLQFVHRGEQIIPSGEVNQTRQSDVVAAINRLNTTTMQLLAATNQTNRGVRGISNDFLKGALTV
jgi:hypothetical protein